MITLTDCGHDGLGHDQLEINEAMIVSVSVDPVRPGEQKTVVTMTGGIWYLVRESVEQVNELIAIAKSGS